MTTQIDPQTLNLSGVPEISQGAATPITAAGNSGLQNVSYKTNNTDNTLATSVLGGLLGLAAQNKWGSNPVGQAIGALTGTGTGTAAGGAGAAPKPAGTPTTTPTGNIGSVNSVSLPAGTSQAQVDATYGTTNGQSNYVVSGVNMTTGQVIATPNDKISPSFNTSSGTFAGVGQTPTTGGSTSTTPAGGLPAVTGTPVGGGSTGTVGGISVPAGTTQPQIDLTYGTTNGQSNYVIAGVDPGTGAVIAQPNLNISPSYNTSSGTFQGVGQGTTTPSTGTSSVVTDLTNSIVGNPTATGTTAGGLPTSTTTGAPPATATPVANQYYTDGNGNYYDAQGNLVYANPNSTVAPIPTPAPSIPTPAPTPAPATPTYFTDTAGNIYDSSGNLVLAMTTGGNYYDASGFLYDPNFNLLANPSTSLNIPTTSSFFDYLFPTNVTTPVDPYSSSYWTDPNVGLPVVRDGGSINKSMATPLMKDGGKVRHMATGGSFIDQVIANQVPVVNASGSTTATPTTTSAPTTTASPSTASTGSGILSTIQNLLGSNSIVSNGGVQGALLGALISQLMSGSGGSSNQVNTGVDMTKVGALQPRTTTFGMGPSKFVPYSQYGTPPAPAGNQYNDLYANLGVAGAKPVAPTGLHYTFGTPVNAVQNLNPTTGQALAKGGLPAPVDDMAEEAQEGELPTVQGRTDYRGGAPVSGEGDGQSDDIPAMLADGEYVIDAEVVSALGNGSNKAGSQVLDEMREAIRTHKRSAPINKIPPKAKSPLEYMKMGANMKGAK